MLLEYMAKTGCAVPIKKLGDGYYMFGTRKIYAKIMNGKLVIRVGGGYMIIEEFIATYADVELARLQKMVERGEQEGEDGELEFTTAPGSSPGGRKFKYLILQEGASELVQKI